MYMIRFVKKMMKKARKQPTYQAPSDQNIPGVQSEGGVA